MARDTTTGQLLRATVLPALEKGGYGWTGRTLLGSRPTGRRHFVDGLAQKGHDAIPVSLNWQQVGGTAERKVPFEAICLAHAVQRSEGRFEKAMLVLGGPGWTTRDWYAGNGLKGHLVHHDLVEIVKMEDFLARAARGDL